MTEDLRTELKDMAGPVRWELIKPHAVRDAVIVVNPQLALTKVGEALATDNTQLVSRWINEQLIAKPTAEQLAQWSSENKLFISLIVQPYVLVQDSLIGEAAIEAALEKAALENISDEADINDRASGATSKKANSEASAADDEQTAG